MKILGTYLPAYHRIPENDKWWGDGFTEWDNVRSGKPYYPGHNQPVEPMNDWYYDLSQVSDLRRQAELARRYNVSGYLMYHYWFGNGRMLFEKPAELLLNNKDIDIEFCFCWANGSWVTTWHGRDPEEIVKQEYPGERDWARHIEYLLPFFQDPRYSKIDNCPVFYFYRADENPEYEKMIVFWDMYLKSKGFNGLYPVEFIFSQHKKLHSLKTKAVMEFEPLYSMYFDISKVELAKRAISKATHRIDYQSYDSMWEKILNRKRTYKGKKIIRGCCCRWDNSPRKEFDSMIMKGSSPEKFEEYLTRLLKSSREDVSEDYLIVNAWNEWSEGAYLEPDKTSGFGYLEAVSNAMTRCGLKG